MSDAVDLDEVVAVLDRGDDAEALPADGETAAATPHPLDLGERRHAIDLDLVPRRARRA